MGKRRLLMGVVLIWMSISFEVCFCDDGATEKSQSRSDRASGKLAEPRKNRTPDHSLIGTVEEADSKVTDTINSAISDASKYASDNVGESGSEAKELSLENAKNTINISKRRLNLAKNEAPNIPLDDRGYNFLEMIEKGMDYGGDVVTIIKGESQERKGKNNDDDNDDDGDKALPPRVSYEYNEAQRKLQELYELAEETSIEKAKNAYEAAKENLSQITGDIGAKLRENNEEL